MKDLCFLFNNIPILTSHFLSIFFYNLLIKLITLFSRLFYVLNLVGENVDLVVYFSSFIKGLVLIIIQGFVLQNC